MEENLGNLDWLNNVLVKTGFEEETTAVKARASIKKNVLMNIFDLLDENWKKCFDNMQDFRKDIVNRRKFYPLQDAKEDSHLKAFLKTVFPAGRNRQNAKK